MSVTATTLTVYDHPLSPYGQNVKIALAEKGAVRPVIDRVFPFADATAAHEHLQGRRSRGKSVLRVERS